MAYISNWKKIFGRYGEDITCSFLQKTGHIIVARNYQKRWGEIDIISIKDNIHHFTEVKSVSRSFALSKGHRPIDNVCGLKTKKLRRMIETYLFENDLGQEREIIFNVACVYYDHIKGKWDVEFMWNVII